MEDSTTCICALSFTYKDFIILHLGLWDFFSTDCYSLSMWPVTVWLQGIRKVANGMIIDYGYINSIHILKEILENNDSFFQDKELALARNLKVFCLHGIFLLQLSKGLFLLLCFQVRWQGFVWFGFPPPPFFFLSISSFHLHLKSQIE